MSAYADTLVIIFSDHGNFGVCKEKLTQAALLNRWAVFFCVDVRTRQAFKRALRVCFAAPAATLRRYYPPFLPAYFGESFLKPILADLSRFRFYPTLDIPKQIKRRTRQFCRHSVDFAAALRPHSSKITFPSGIWAGFALAFCPGISAIRRRFAVPELLFPSKRGCRAG